jgi:small Trp-rich protein
MYAVVIGLLLVLAKYFEFGPFADWSWWVILSPFLVAFLWWQFADSSGWTKQREIDRIEQKKQERREKALDALGIDRNRDRQVRKARDAARERVAGATGRDEARDARAAPPPGTSEEPRRDPRM